MIINLYKDNAPIVETLTQEQQICLTSLDLSYKELSDMYIMAMIFGHGVDVLNMELCETEDIESVVALCLSAKEINVKSVENCNSSFEILSKLYPEKTAKLRRAKMLGKNLWEVITNE